MLAKSEVLLSNPSGDDDLVHKGIFYFLFFTFSFLSYTHFFPFPFLVATLESFKSNRDYIVPMFQVSWGSMLSVFSILFRDTENKAIYELCTQGFVYAIGKL